jgi:hypothetical protein
MDPPVAGGWQNANTALFGNYLAASLVSAAGGQGGTVMNTTAQGEQPLLTHRTREPEAPDSAHIDNEAPLPELALNVISRDAMERPLRGAKQTLTRDS